MLIVSRAVLGVAAATLAPSTLSLIRNMFLDPAQRTFAIGVWATSFSVGAALGPLFGGLLLEFFWWGSVFLLAVPVMALLLVLGPKLLPEFRDPNAGRLDLVSAGLSVVAVLAVIYGLKEIAARGFEGRPLLAVLVGLALGLVFVRRQQVLDDPLIDLQLFRSRTFTAALGSNTLSISLAFGIFFLIAQYLQLVLGYSPLQAGLWTIPSAGGFIAGSMLAPLLVRTLRPAYVVAGGLTLTAAGLALLAQVAPDSSVALVVVGSVVVALGVAPPVTLGTDLVVSGVAPERAGVASGISETGAELGGALGIAVLGSISVAVYRNELADSVAGGRLAGGDRHARRRRRDGRDAPGHARHGLARGGTGGVHAGDAGRRPDRRSGRPRRGGARLRVRPTDGRRRGWPVRRPGRGPGHGAGLTEAGRRLRRAG